LAADAHSPDFYAKHGKRGGRPRQYPECPAYKNEKKKTHRFDPKTGICHGCGFNRETKCFPKKRI